MGIDTSSCGAWRTFSDWILAVLLSHKGPDQHPQEGGDRAFTIRVRAHPPGGTFQKTKEPLQVLRAILGLPLLVKANRRLPVLVPTRGLVLALDHQARQDRWKAQTQTALGAAKHPACHPSRVLLLLTCSWWWGRWIVSEQCREQLKMEIGKPHPDPSPQPAMGYSRKQWGKM